MATCGPDPTQPALVRSADAALWFRAVAVCSKRAEQPLGTLPSDVPRTGPAGGPPDRLDKDAPVAEPQLRTVLHVDDDPVDVEIDS